MKSTPTILLLEDDRRVAELVRWELGNQFEVVHANNYTEALDYLYRAPDLIAIVAHHNVRHGAGGARFMVEAARVRPDARRILYSSSPSAAHEALGFAHAFLVRPWPHGDLLSMLRLHAGGAASGAEG